MNAGLEIGVYTFPTGSFVKENCISGGLPVIEDCEGILQCCVDRECRELTTL